MSTILTLASSHIRPSLFVNRCLLRTVGSKAGQIQDGPPKASPEQLNRVADVLSNHSAHFFSEAHPFNLYTRNVIFINNIRSIKTQGLGQYAIQIMLIKCYFLISRTSRKVELLNLIRIPEESCIKIRWRIVTKPGLARFLFTSNKLVDESWKDGISTVHVNNNGLIYCHVCDNIDVDIDGGKVEKTIKNPLVNRGLSV